jgi:hypothetical protein
MGGSLRLGRLPALSADIMPGAILGPSYGRNEASWALFQYQEGGKAAIHHQRARTLDEHNKRDPSTQQHFHLFLHVTLVPHHKLPFPLLWSQYCP